MILHIITTFFIVMIFYYDLQNTLKQSHRYKSRNLAIGIIIAIFIMALIIFDIWR